MREKHDGLICVVVAVVVTSGCTNNVGDSGVAADARFPAADADPSMPRPDGAAGSPDGATSSDGSMSSPDAPVPNGLVPVIMAFGHLGRTLYSCDGGNNWRGDRSDNPAGRCWVSGDPNYVECDHTPLSTTGSAYGDGYFYHQTGWGAPSQLRRTSDGLTWTTVRMQGNGGTVTTVDGAVLVWDSQIARSTDHGATFTGLPGYGIDYPKFYEAGDMRVALGRTNGMVVTADGLTWGPQINPLNGDIGGVTFMRTSVFAGGNGKMVAAFSAGDTTYTAVSSDNGVTWNRQVTSDQGVRGLTFNGTQFEMWTWGRRYLSTDGASWTQDGGGIDGIAFFDPRHGRYVVFNHPFGAQYSQQTMRTSTDGKTWTNAATYPPGHPIEKFSIGYLPESSCN